jgi:hypothetical protein
MEHITITQVADGVVRLTPDEGFLVKNKKSGRLYSEVVCKDNEQQQYEAAAMKRT